VPTPRWVSAHAGKTVLLGAMMKKRIRMGATMASDRHNLTLPDVKSKNFLGKQVSAWWWCWKTGIRGQGSGIRRASPHASPRSEARRVDKPRSGAIHHWERGKGGKAGACRFLAVSREYKKPSLRAFSRERGEAESEAIQRFFCCAHFLDCFASLAMTPVFSLRSMRFFVFFAVKCFF